MENQENGDFMVPDKRIATQYLAQSEPKVVTYEDVTKNQTKSEFTLIIEAINKKLMLNEFPMTFEFKPRTRSEVIFEVVKNLRQAGWSVSLADSKPCVITVNPVENNNDTSNQIQQLLIQNPNYQYTTSFREGLYTAHLDGFLYREGDASIPVYKDVNGKVVAITQSKVSAISEVRFSIQAEGENSDAVESEILRKYERISETMMKKRFENTYKNDLTEALKFNRRTGQTTTLMKTAMEVHGWVIFGNESQAAMFRKDYKYDRAISINSLSKMRGNESAPMFFDTTAIHSLMMV